jgi:hypothetical protein
MGKTKKNEKRRLMGLNSGIMRILKFLLRLFEEVKRLFEEVF